MHELQVCPSSILNLIPCYHSITILYHIYHYNTPLPLPAAPWATPAPSPAPMHVPIQYYTISNIIIYQNKTISSPFPPPPAAPSATPAPSGAPMPVPIRYYTMSTPLHIENPKYPLPHSPAAPSATPAPSRAPTAWPAPSTTALPWRSSPPSPATARPRSTRCYPRCSWRGGTQSRHCVPRPHRRRTTCCSTPFGWRRGPWANRRREVALRKGIA